MNTRAACCVNILVVAALSVVVTFMDGCGPRTYAPSTPAEKAAYNGISSAYASMDAGYAEKKPDMVWAYRQPGFGVIDQTGQGEDPDRMKADVDAKIQMADSIGCQSTIRNMHLSGTTATIYVRERVEWSIKLPADMPKGFALPTGDGGMPSMVETTVAKDTWSQTPQGWLLANRVVTSHHMAARREDQ